MDNEAASLGAKRRRFAPDHQFNDWLAAESQADELLASKGYE
jgi:hypothetical protein